jgi:DNA-binding transcriptional MerR regulator
MFKLESRRRDAAGVLSLSKASLQGFSMSTHYQIGEFAELGGVSAKTLRFYDEIGLLHPASVDPRTGYRHYVPQQLEDLASILALKNLGISLAQVRELTRRSSSAERRKGILRALKKTVEHSIRTATHSLQWIDAALVELEERQQPVAVVVKRRPAIPIASLRVTLKHYAEVSRFERELSDALPPENVSGLRGVLWHRCADSGSLEAEPFVGRKRWCAASVPCEMKHLPEATLACAYSGLDDESSERAYAAIRRWMNVRGYQLAGPKRELYLGEMLEIQFPIR